MCNRIAVFDTKWGLPLGLPLDCLWDSFWTRILSHDVLEIPTILLRYDQQKSKIEGEDIFNTIKVDDFKTYLIEYCMERLDGISDVKLLINQIVYIFTVFGIRMFGVKSCLKLRVLRPIAHHPICFLRAKVLMLMCWFSTVSTGIVV